MYKLDLTDYNQIQKFINKISSKFKNITLINCATFKNEQFTVDINLEDWNHTVGVNLTGAMLITKELLKYMINNKFGRIVFFSSSIALNGSPGTASYTTTKAGIIGLSKTISKEYARYNITSNVINLGAFQTGLYNKLDAKYKKKIISSIPSKKLGELNNISNCINFLIESEFVNGSVIDITGGA